VPSRMHDAEGLAVPPEVGEECPQDEEDEEVFYELQERFY